MKTTHVTHIISYCYSNHGSLAIAISDYSSVELQLKEKQIYKNNILHLECQTFSFLQNYD